MRQECFDLCICLRLCPSSELRLDPCGKIPNVKVDVTSINALPEAGNDFLSVIRVARRDVQGMNYSFTLRFVSLKLRTEFLNLRRQAWRTDIDTIR